jgi:error-prone DNA polymerase
MFAHLHVHSFYSFLSGTASPTAYLERAAELGIPAVALTDHNNVSGAVVDQKIAIAVFAQQAIMPCYN